MSEGTLPARRKKPQESEAWMLHIQGRYALFTAICTGVIGAIGGWLVKERGTPGLEQSRAVADEQRPQPRLVETSAHHELSALGLPTLEVVSVDPVGYDNTDPRNECRMFRLKIVNPSDVRYGPEPSFVPTSIKKAKLFSLMGNRQDNVVLPRSVTRLPIKDLNQAIPTSFGFCFVIEPHSTRYITVEFNADDDEESIVEIEGYVNLFYLGGVATSKVIRIIAYPISKESREIEEDNAAPSPPRAPNTAAPRPSA